MPLSGQISTTLMRQSILDGSQRAGIASIGTTDFPGDGFQVKSKSIPTVTIDPGTFSYYIEVNMSRTSATVTNITAYDVGLGVHCEVLN